MRAFIAIVLPSGIKGAVSKIQGELKTTLPKISWTKPDNLHITLKFLGEISPQQLSNIKQVITEVAKTNTWFQIKFKTIGVFPNIKQARIIWIGTNQVPLRMKKIVEQLELKCMKLGIPKEKRLFYNHITVGRIKNNTNTTDLEKELNKVRRDLINKDFEFDVGRIILFKSTLASTGPTYTVLDETSLKTT